MTIALVEGVFTILVQSSTNGTSATFLWQSVYRDYLLVSCFFKCESARFTGFDKNSWVIDGADDADSLLAFVLELHLLLLRLGCWSKSGTTSLSLYQIAC